MSSSCCRKHETTKGKRGSWVQNGYLSQNRSAFVEGKEDFNYVKPGRYIFDETPRENGVFFSNRNSEQEFCSNRNQNLVAQILFTVEMKLIH